MTTKSVAKPLSYFKTSAGTPHLLNEIVANPLDFPVEIKNLVFPNNRAMITVDIDCFLAERWWSLQVFCLAFWKDRIN